MLTWLAAVIALALGEGAPTSIDPPAPPGAFYPALAAESATTVAKGHDVLLTWLEPGESGGRLRFSRLSQGTWSEPITVADRVSTLDPADRPSLVVFDTQAVRRTLIARTGDVIARSGNAGRTWGRLPAAALPFASFAGGDEGGYAFWLHSNGDGSKLLGTRILAGESLLDPRAAGGSSTAAAMTWDGPVVVYRDRAAQGAVDIAVVRRQNARWTPSRPVHVGGWRPDQKPESGPQVAALRRQVAVAWYTEAAHRPRVLVAFSSDAGRTFDAPIEVDAAEPGRDLAASVAVTVDDNGDALVLWMAGSGPEGAALNLARLSPGGQRGKELVLAEGLAAGPQDIPQITRAGPRAAVTWIAGDPERPASRRVRLITVPLTDVPGAPARLAESAIAGAGTAVPPSGPAGDPAPDLGVVSLDGAEVSLPSLRGHAVLLNLWATWCIPCRAEFPELVALYREYAGKGLVMVGLNVDGAASGGRVREFVAEREIPFEVWLDPQMRLYSALGVKALPVTIVIDREGRMILRRDGTITADDRELREALGRALGGS